MKRILFVALFFLPVSAFASESLDAYYDINDDAESAVNTTNSYSQEWVAIASASIPYVDILSKGSSCTGAVRVSIRSTTGGVPDGSGSELAGVTVSDCSTFSTSATWNRFTFSSPFNQVAGTKYAIAVLKTTGSGSFNLRWDSSSSGYLANGTFRDTVTPTTGDTYTLWGSDDTYLFRVYKTDASGTSAVYASSTAPETGGIFGLGVVALFFGVCLFWTLLFVAILK